MFFVLAIALVGMVVAPFAKAALLYLAIKAVKFRDVGYWRSFFCVLIGFGAIMAAQMVLMGLSMQPGQEFDPEAIQGANMLSMLLGLVVVPLAEFVALLLFFKQSVGRTVGAIALHYLFCVAACVVLFLIVFGIMMIIGLLTG